MRAAKLADTPSLAAQLGTGMTDLIVLMAMLREEKEWTCDVKSFSRNKRANADLRWHILMAYMCLENAVPASLLAPCTAKAN